MSGLSKQNFVERRATVQSNKWTFDKSISYGDLLVTVSLLLGGLTAYFTAEKRISQLEYRNSQQEDAMKVLSGEMRLELKELKQQSIQTQMEVLRMAGQQKERPNGTK
jgi:uncharacterized coiled-coil protein SlyX